MEKNLEREILPTDNPYAIPMAIVIAGAMFSAVWLYNEQNPPGKTVVIKNQTDIGGNQEAQSAEEEAVLPIDGVVLPVSWGDLGSKLTSVGAIDGGKFRALYLARGEFPAEYEKLLSGSNPGKLKITKNNAGYLLNLLWALGLASKNPILDNGEMKNPAYGGAQNFASTAGWTIAQGGPMDHYSRHKFFELTTEQQVLVEKVSRGIYRPCCGNSTHFPDCNHGMAMLGLLELMASQGVNEQDMWKTALAVNSYWFPDTYLTIAFYMKGRGVEWKDVDPQEILGINYSSSTGYARIASQVTAPSSSQGRSGSGCGVDTGEPIIAPTQQSGSGCNI